MITIDLDAIPFASGRWQCVFRTTAENKLHIAKAAATRGISTARFIRLVVGQAANQVIGAVDQQFGTGVSQTGSGNASRGDTGKGRATRPT